MSADNWEICPQCLWIAKNGKEADRKKVEEQYGKLSLQEWLELAKSVNLGAEYVNAAAEVNEEDYRTVSEYYEIGLDGTGSGTFFIRYNGDCRACDFRYEYNLDNVVWSPPDTIADKLLHQYEISGEFSDLRDFLREAIAEYMKQTHSIGEIENIIKEFGL